MCGLPLAFVLLTANLRRLSLPMAPVFGYSYLVFFFFFQAEDGIRGTSVTGVQTCALPILDGEILAMRGEQVLPFADLQRRLGRREGDLFLGEEIPVRYIAFDLLWRDGKSFLDEIGRASCRERG